MKVNYDYITYEDVLRARQFAYESAYEHHATDSILNSARDVFSQGSYDICIKICEGLLDSKDPKQLYDSKKLIALSYYSKQDYENADKTFFELTQNSNNSDDWFNAVISATLNKNFDRSKECFGIALEKYTQFGHQRNMPSVQLMLHYMINLIEVEAYEMALEQFHLLKQVYQKIKKTEESYLRSRGLEKVHDFLTASAKILNQQSPENIKAIQQELMADLDEKGKIQVDLFFSDFQK